MFETPRARLLDWAVQRRSGASVYPPGIPPAEGNTVLVGFGVGPARIIAPCRIGWTVDGPSRAGSARVGFGYGTLPGHPAWGE